MADISGTVLVNGAVPTDYVYVDAFDLNDPEYIYEPAGLLDYNGYATVSQVDGSYTVTGLVAGHDHLLVAGNVVDTALPQFVNGATNWGDSHAVSAPSAGVNFNCPAPASGVMFTASSANCPAGTSFVFAYVVDPDIGININFLFGLPNGPLTPAWHNLYAAENYRILYTAVDDAWNELATRWYDDLPVSEGYGADTVLGNATGVVLDFTGAGRIIHPVVKAGAGPHFSKPKPTKRYLLKK